MTDYRVTIDVQTDDEHTPLYDVADAVREVARRLSHDDRGTVAVDPDERVGLTATFTSERTTPVHATPGRQGPPDGHTPHPVRPHVSDHLLAHIVREDSGS